MDLGDFDLTSDNEGPPVEKVKKKKKKKKSKEKKSDRNRRRSVEDELEGAFSTFLGGKEGFLASLNDDGSGENAAVEPQPLVRAATAPPTSGAGASVSNPPPALRTAMSSAAALDSVAALPPPTPIAVQSLSTSDFGDSLLDLLDSPAPRKEGGNWDAAAAADDTAAAPSNAPPARVSAATAHDDDLAEGWSMSSSEDVAAAAAAEPTGRAPPALAPSPQPQPIASTAATTTARRRRGSILDAPALAPAAPTPAAVTASAATIAPSTPGSAAFAPAFAPAPAAAALRSTARSSASTRSSRMAPMEREISSPAAVARASSVRDVEIAQLRAEARASQDELSLLQQRHARELDEQRERLQEGDDSAAARLRARLHALETQVRDLFFIAYYN